MVGKTHLETGGLELARGEAPAERQDRLVLRFDSSSIESDLLCWTPPTFSEPGTSGAGAESVSSLMPRERWGGWGGGGGGGKKRATVVLPWMGERSCFCVENDDPDLEGLSDGPYRGPGGGEEGGGAGWKENSGADTSVFLYLN